MYEMISIISLGILFLGVIVPNFIGYMINKKNKYISKTQFLKLSITFLVAFIVSAKLFQFILDKVYEDYELKQLFNFRIIFSMIFSGYTFFGGYVGALIVILVANKKKKLNKELCFWFVNNLNLMYAIMKIHCFLKGCCYGFTIIPTQLLESMISFIIYIAMIIIYKKSKKANMCTGLSIILFSTERLIISFYRAYMTDFAYIGTEVVCVMLMVLGSIIFLKNIKEKL